LNVANKIVIEEDEIAVQPKVPVTKGMPGLIKIILEENDAIPPTGLYVGFNGMGYLIRPGEEVSVPQGVVDILDNAVYTTPRLHSVTKQTVGYSSKRKYPYQRLAA
jgi:hypothetical protein